MSLDLATVRSRFPGLDDSSVFFDNAGGTQILQSVIDRMQDYLVTSNVQLGASYEVSATAKARVGEASAAMATLIHAADPSEVVMGPSSTQLLAMVARAIGETLSPGDEIIVSDADHESNVGPWLRLAKRGIVVKTWETDRDSLELRLADLERLMTERTRLVAVTHTSNILGSIVPIRQIARFVHDRGAQICVDGVAYAPHRLVDVQDLDVDYYVFSFYKVFGPHYALLYGKREHLLALPSQNHDFIPETAVPYKFQPGNVNYELAYGMLGLCDYASEMADRLGPAVGSARGRFAALFDWIAEQEETLADRLLAFLAGKSNVRVIGPSVADRRVRLPIISFVATGIDSATVPQHTDRHAIGIRYGDFYSARLIDALSLREANGVVRVSMAHYNTVEEVDRLIAVLDRVI